MDVAKLEAFKQSISEVVAQAQAFFDEELLNVDRQIGELQEKRADLMKDREVFLSQLGVLGVEMPVGKDTGITLPPPILGDLISERRNGHAAVRQGRVGRPPVPLNEKVLRRLNAEFTIDDVRKAVSRYGSARLAGVTLAQLSRKGLIKKTKDGYRKLQ